MKILKEKFLKEEELQNETDIEETNVDTPVEEPTEEPVEPEITNDIDTQEKKVWKVSFKLGEHDNWSRFESATKDKAKEAVEKYITKKWPNRRYKFLDIEEFIEESLTESITDDATPIEEGPKVGMASVIGDLIKDEYEAIDGYNAAIATAQAEGFEDAVRVLTEIQAEENIHVGQLQEVMKLFDPNADKVEDGQAEGAEQLANPIEDSDVVNEDLDNMGRHDQEMFIRCVNEIWGMSVIEWIQKYHGGQLEIITVDKYDDIPDTSNLIEISATDISQGTGNVIVYTYMNAGDGTLYRYADY